jgi:hypothetical protein
MAFWLSKFISNDAAEIQLRTHLGCLHGTQSAGHLEMKVAS